MPNEDSRRIPAEKAATVDELTEAINGLTRIERKKLESSARYRIRGLGKMAARHDWRELVNETILAFYRPDGRRWKKDEVDLVRTLTEAMRSVAYNWKRSFDENEAMLESEMQTASESGRESFSLSNVPGGHWDTQADLEAEEELEKTKEKLKKIEQLLLERELASLILLGMKDEMTGADIRKDLGISEREYETEMTWIRRKVRATFKEKE